jgi:hypothetical protein
MRLSAIAASTGALLLVGVVLTGCGGKGPTSSEARTELTTGSTPRTMAAAVIEHMDGYEPSAAAPPEGWRPSIRGIGAEVAFPIDDHSVHVIAGASPQLTEYRPDLCEQKDTQYLDGCVNLETEDGDPMRISWQRAVPEEDPGYVDVFVLRDHEVVMVAMYGTPVPADPREGGLPFDFGILRDIATDPGVGLRTSADLVEAGDAIDDDVWLDCYGEDNGTTCPSPESG